VQVFFFILMLLFLFALGWSGFSVWSDPLGQFSGVPYWVILLTVVHVMPQLLRSARSFSKTRKVQQ
jgi:hypothetical protein